MATDAGLTKEKKKQLQVVIIILLVLVLVTAAVAVALHFKAKNASTSDPVKITQNVIGSTTKSPEDNDASDNTSASDSKVSGNVSSDDSSQSSSDSEKKDMTIELGKGNEEENKPFEMMGMLPGDKETKTFNLKVYNKDTVKVVFSAEKKSEEKNYADALDVEVKDKNSGEVLFLGTFSELISNGTTIDIPTTEGNVTELSYAITVSMDIEKDNQYQYGKLVADFKWSVIKEDRPSLEKIPSTGDTAMMYAVVGVAAVAVIALAICLSRSKKKESGEQI